MGGAQPSICDIFVANKLINNQTEADRDQQDDLMMMCTKTNQTNKAVGVARTCNNAYWQKTPLRM